MKKLSLWFHCLILLLFILLATAACVSRPEGVGSKTPDPISNTPPPSIAAESVPPASSPFVENSLPPTLLPDPTSDATPAPTPDIVITKHPNNDPGIIEGNTQISIARAENGELIHWQFTPPDDSIVYTDTELEQVFPVKVYKIDSETLWIVSIPLSMDGYKVRAVFANDKYTVYSDWASIHVIGFFTQIAHSYMLCSGVGAWSTTVDINDDGSFSGFFHDWDAIGPNGEHSYQVESYFSGQFGKVGKIADHVYTMELLWLSPEGSEGEKYLDENGTTHVVTSPYGFENASLFYVYTPGVKISDLQDGFYSWINNYNEGDNNWANMYDLAQQTYRYYGLYNYYGQYGFFECTPETLGEAS